MKKLKIKKILKKIILSSIILVILFTNINSDMFKILATSIAPTGDQSSNSIIQTVNQPRLLPGMTAVRMYSESAVIVREPLINKDQWYDYSNNIWANAKTKDGSLWVWIPTFAYKITYYNDENKTSIKGYTANNGYYNANNERVTDFELVKSKYFKIETKFVTTSTSLPNGWQIHPAFYKGDASAGRAQVLAEGFWMSKGLAQKSQDNMPIFSLNQTNPDYKNWFDAYNSLDQLAFSENKYGLTGDFAKVNLPRNTEMGSLIYLTIANNMQNSEYSTGNNSGIILPKKEWTAAYVNNQSRNLPNTNSSANAIVPGMRDLDEIDKIEKYPYSSKTDATYNDHINELRRNALLFSGDALYEVTYPSISQNGSNNDGVSIYPTGDNPFIIRNGTNNIAGYEMANGSETNIGYRAVIYGFPMISDQKVTITFRTPRGNIYVKGNRDNIYGDSNTPAVIQLTKGSAILDQSRMFEVGDYGDDFRFSGWSESVYGVPIYKSMEVTPTFVSSNPPAPITHEVTFKDETGHIYKVGRVLNREDATILANLIKPEKEGYRFIKWDKDITAEITSDTVFTAIFEKLNQTTKKFKVRFLNDDNSVFDEKDVNENEYVEIPNAIPTSSNKVFLGWQPDPSKTLITSNTEFKANFKETSDLNDNNISDSNNTNNNNSGNDTNTNNTETINIRINLNGGKADSLEDNKVIKIKKGTSLKDQENLALYTLLTTVHPTKQDYVFSNWTIDFDKEITEDTVISAVYSPMLYKFEYVEFIKGEKKILSEGTFKSGSILKDFEPENLKKAGYSFIGWTNDNTKPQYSNVQFIAMWEYSDIKEMIDNKIEVQNIDPITVKFDLDGGVWPSGVKNPKSSYILPRGMLFTSIPKPEKEGYEFLRWQGDENINLPLIKDTSFKAIWSEKPKEISKNTSAVTNTTGNNNNNNNSNSNNLNNYQNNSNNVNNNQVGNRNLPVNSQSNGINLRPVENLNGNNGTNNLTSNKLPGVTKQSEIKGEIIPKAGNNELVKWLLILIIPILAVVLVHNILKYREIQNNK